MEKLPEAFIQRIRDQLGNEADSFFLALSQPSPTSIRLHHLKGHSSFTNVDNVPWCDEGYYLESRPFFHMDPHWHGGAYYVQEASSMILDYVVGQINEGSQPKIWLDACAAPGGKTGILAKHLNDHDVLVANEVVSQRRSVLWENLYKAGYKNVFITGEPSSAFKQPFADIILVDAPCAGEGMMRKEPEAIKQWSESLVRECSLMQQRIVNDVMKALLPGGYLIYSTCSYSEAENIGNVSRFINESSLSSMQIHFPKEWNITTIGTNEITGYQLFPHKVKGEGLFIAVLKKEASEEYPMQKTKRQRSSFESAPDWLTDQINSAEKLVIQNDSANYSFIGAEAEIKANELLRLFPKAELVAEAGLLKRKDFIPSHFLAMSGMHSLNTERIDLSLEQSLDYLERNTTTLPSGRAAGWYLISYQNTTLGWAKNTPQGWKNHYPLNWRLRSRKM